MIKKILFIVTLLVLLSAFSCPKKNDNKIITLKPDTEQTESVDEPILNDNPPEPIENNQNIITPPETPTPPKTNNTQPTPKKQQPKKVTTTTKSTYSKSDPEFGDFTAQLIALKDPIRAEEIRKMLSDKAYYTEIQETYVNGNVMYRVRLSGSYSKPYAAFLGDCIVKEFPEISSYWVDRR